jgi:ATP-binding cassette subfamily B protein RaxB
VYFYPIRRIQEELINDEAREESIFLETLRSVQTLKLYGQEHHRTNLWMNRSADVVNSGIRLSKLNIAENTLVQILVGLESILLLYFGALAVMNEELTIGMLLAFIAYKTIFTQSVYNLIEKGFEFKLLGLHLERLSDITLHRRVKDRPNSLPAGNHLKGRLRFEKVGYRFPSNDQWVFRNLSFDITPGESVAIVGPSGSGKTTLLKTFLRLLEPSEGIISADGIDVSKIRLKDFRNRVSTVMQDDCLFSGTITDNVTLFQSDVCPEKLAYFCEMAGIREDIEAMPMKYSSLVGDMGSTLSGGQVQRILLARALFSEPDILVLDESTSHLDTKTESILNDNIRDMNITRIIVAHRKDTIDSADRVINIHPDQLM